MRKFLFSLVLSTLLLAGNGWGATYYVNQAGGSDANNGLSTGSAWKTIAKVNASSFAAGDSILFKRGETWREQLTPPSRGSAGSPITFGAYGTGNAPIISGSDLVTTWTDNTSNRWIATVTTEPRVVTFDNVMGIKGTSAANVNAAYKWYWAANVLYVFSTSNPAAAYTAPGIEVGKRLAGIRPDNKDYVTIRDIQVWGANQYAIYGETHNHITVDNIVVKKQGGAGIQFSTDSTYSTIINSTFDTLGATGDGNAIWIGADNSVITGNTITMSGTISVGADGIQTSNADKVIVSNNTIDMSSTTGSAKHCIIVQGGAGPHVVSGNTLTGCPDQGIMMDVGDIIISNNLIRNVRGNGNGIGLNNETPVSNVTIRYNFMYGVANGIRSNVSVANNISNLNIYNNTIYADVGTGNALALGINISGNIKNNIFYSSLASGEGRVVNFGNNSIIGGQTLEMNNNIIYPEGTDFMRAMGYARYSTLASWVSATGYDTHSKTSAPLFVSTVTPDFHLQSGSPAINAGTSVGLTRDFSGNLVPFGSAPDIGAYEFTSLKTLQVPLIVGITP